MVLIHSNLTFTKLVAPKIADFISIGYTRQKFNIANTQNNILFILSSKTVPLTTKFALIYSLKIIRSIIYDVQCSSSDESSSSCGTGLLGF